MSASQYRDNQTWVELGEPLLFGGGKSRSLLIAAALGAPPESRHQIDLALLQAASEKEDLRHYEQIGFIPLDRHSRHSVARVRRRGADVEKLIARGEVEAILGLFSAGDRRRYREMVQEGAKVLEGYRWIAVATWSITPEGKDGWRFLGCIPVRVCRPRTPSLWDRLLRWCKIR